MPAASTEAKTLRAALHGAVTRWTAFGKTERVSESDAAAARRAAAAAALRGAAATDVRGASPSTLRRAASYINAAAEGARARARSGTVAASAAAAAASGLGDEAAVIDLCCVVYRKCRYCIYFTFASAVRESCRNPQSPLREGARCRARVRQSLPCLDPTHGTHGLAEIVDSYCVS